MIEIAKDVAKRLPDKATMLAHVPRVCSMCSFYDSEWHICDFLEYGFDSDFDGRREKFLGCPYKEVANGEYYIKDA